MFQHIVEATFPLIVAAWDAGYYHSMQFVTETLAIMLEPLAHKK